MAVWETAMWDLFVKSRFHLRGSYPEIRRRLALNWKRAFRQSGLSVTWEFSWIQDSVPMITLPMLPKAILRDPNYEYFPPRLQSAYSPASWLRNSIILPLSCQAPESVQKFAVKVVQGLRHVPYETALQRLRLLFLVRRRIRGDLISV